MKQWGTLAAAIICVFVLTTINQTGMVLKKELAQEESSEFLMPEMETNENSMVTSEEVDEDVEAKAEAEPKDAEEPMLETRDTGEIEPNAIYIEVSGDLILATNAVLEEMENLEIDALEIETGSIQLMRVNDEEVALIIEKLEKIGHIIKQSDFIDQATINIYLIQE